MKNVLVPRFFARGLSAVAIVFCSIAGVDRAAAQGEATELINLSGRGQVRTDDNVLIGGLVIRGDRPRQVILRALGPSLSVNGVGVQGRLSDPTLTLHRAGIPSPLASNDNWRDWPDSENFGRFRPEDERDSIMALILEPGAYTTIVRGVNGATGIALVEAYYADEQDTRALANISVRGMVESGDNILIGGFVVEGGLGGGVQTLGVVIRALGPSLASAGLANPLQDPTLQLVNNNGAVIASNDNWRDGAFAEIERSGFAPRDAREAVIIAQLPPGRYTAIVRSSNQSTGTGLVEIYHYPAGER